MSSHVGTGRTHPQNIPTELGASNCCKIFLYAEALRVSFTRAKGLSPTPEKQLNTTIPTPLNFTLGTVHSDKYCSPGNIPENRWKSIIRHFIEHIFTALGSSGACFTPLHPRLYTVLGDVWFGCSSSAIEPHSTLHLHLHCIEEISELDLLHWWYPITGPCWNSLSC